MAKGILRLGIACAIVALGFVAVLGGLALTFPAEQIRKAAKDEISRATGLDLNLHGEVATSMLPVGAVSFSKVTLGEDAVPALAADRLTARLRVLPLFAGRIEVSELILERPHINIVIESNGRTNWTGLIERLAETLGPREGRGDDQGAAFSEMRIAGGTVTVRDESRGITETLREVEMALAWPSISRSFAATGRFIWHNEPIDASLSLADFAAALTGQRSGVKLRLTSAPLKLAFDGAASTRPTLKVEGTLAGDGPSLRDTLRWVGVRPLTGGGFGRFSLKAKTNVVGGTIALSAVNVELDGNSAEGVLTFATDGRQTLQGTLAANEFDLTPYVSAVRLMTVNERDWNSLPISLDNLDGFDLDLRLSAAKIAIARARLGKTAIAANLRGGNLTVTIGEVQAFGGIVRGTLGLAASKTGADIKSQLQFNDIDLESGLRELFGFNRIEGRGDMALIVEASGESMLGLAQAMNGTATLMGRQGALLGVNVEQLLRRLERRPLSGAGDYRSGRTPFETLKVDVKIARGVASIEEVRLNGPKVRLGLAGSASIPARDLDLRGVAALVAADTESPPPFELPFMVQGPWDDPIMLPDTQSLILRSPAGAPLLDAVKGRSSTRDTVRSAIERLTGGAIPAPARPAPPDPLQPKR